MRSRLTRATAMVAVAGLLAGCAHIYVDEEGSRNVIGLAWVKLPPSAGSTAADVGYSDSNLVVVRDNQCVDVSPL